jgi:AcrR family transcriptional regulator
MGKMSQKSNPNNRQVQRTRSWIFDAFMILIDEKPYDKITVSDITEKAGIARQTFYRNYDDKKDVLIGYLRKTTNADSLLNIEINQSSSEQNNIVLVFNYAYMIKHRDILKKILSIADIENYLLYREKRLPLSLLKRFEDKLTKKGYTICRYKLCYQISGCLRVILDWFMNNMPLPVDKLVSLLNTMNTSKEVSFWNIPNIIIRIKKE